MSIVPDTGKILMLYTNVGTVNVQANKAEHIYPKVQAISFPCLDDEQMDTVLMSSKCPPKLMY